MGWETREGCKRCDEVSRCVRESVTVCEGGCEGECEGV